MEAPLGGCLPSTAHPYFGEVGLKTKMIPRSPAAYLACPPKPAFYRALLNLGKPKLKIKLMMSFPPQLCSLSPNPYQWCPTFRSESGESSWSPCPPLPMPQVTSLVLFAANVALMSAIFLLSLIGLPTPAWNASKAPRFCLSTHFHSILLPLEAATS